MIKRDVTFGLVLLGIFVFCCCGAGADFAECKEVGIDKLSSGFAEPDMIYAPFAFWFWDKALDAGQVADMAEEMCKQRMNPGYAHGRTGLPEEQWISDKWFECFGKAISSTKKYKCHVGYCDEYNWPSGNAMGKVLERHPELQAVSLKWDVQDVKGPAEVKLGASFFTVTAKRVEPADGKGWPIKIHRDSIRLIGSGDGFNYCVPEGVWRIYTFNKAFHKGIDSGSVNCLDRRLVKAFTDIVHEKYAERFSDEFGKTVAGVFVDHEGDYGWRLAWSDDLDKEFKQKTGADIRGIMPLMIDEDPEGVFAKARWDWYEVVSDIYSDSFLGGVSDWVKAHGMYTISNLWESNWGQHSTYPNLNFQAFAVGDFFKAQRRVTMPGNDCLCDKPYEVYDFKETQSVCEFEGRRFMTELLGVAGWQMTPITMKKATNSVISFGVSHIVPHGVNLNRQLSTIPYPPDWFNSNPYWRYFHLWSDFARRASYVNAHGRLAPDILLVNPMDSIWALYGSGIFDFGYGDFSFDSTGHKETLGKIDKVYYFAVRQLQAARMEYLATDRYYLRKMKVKEDGRLSYKGFEFKTIVLPDMVVLPLDVAEKILNFAEKGGYVYSLGDLPSGSTDNGLNDPKMAAMMEKLEKLPNFKKTNDGVNGLLAEKAAGLKPQIEFEKGAFGIMHQHRIIDGKDFFWVVNNTDEGHDCVLKVKNVKGMASIWDCETGEIKDVASKVIDGGEAVAVGFTAYQAYWLVFDPAREALDSAVEEQALETVAKLDGPWNVRIDMADQPGRVADDQKVIVPDCLTQQQGENKELANWNEWGLDMFSGFVDYTRNFDCNKRDGRIVLDLGKVNYTAEVWVNDKKVGAKIWPPFEFDITDYVKDGGNKVFIRIGNTLYNTMRQYEGNKKSQFLWGWLDFAEDEKNSGLFGPVAVKGGCNNE